MAQVIISSLPPLPNGTGSAVPKGTDLSPATDTTDTSVTSTGQTNKYTRAAELNFVLTSLGLTTYTAVLAASTIALTATYANGTLGVGATLTNAGAQAALTLDGVTLAVGNRVLIKNQAAPAQNGIYTVSVLGSASVNWVLIRATDYDTAAEVIQYGVMLVNQGTLSAGLLYQESGAGPFTMGTTSITFEQYTISGFLPQTWSGAANITQAAAVNSGYVIQNASQTTVTLPASMNLGAVVSVRGMGAGGWILAANTGQIIRMGNQVTSTAGTLTSANRYDTVDVRCIVNDTTWTVESVISTGLTVA